LARAVAYDISRLFIGPLSATPRGIDRVDLALAGHVFERGGSNVFGILPTPWGIRAYGADQVRAGLKYLHHIWSESRDPTLDPAWADLRARLNGRAGQPVVAPAVRSLPLASKCLRMGSHLSATGFSLGRPVRSALPRNAIYLNVGQIGLAVPLLFDWLDNRPDITSVFMLHDVIPLEYPQYVAASSVRHHARMVQSAARHAHGLIVTTRHAEQTVTAALGQRGRTAIPTLVRGLPLPSVFADGGTGHPHLRSIRYFVVCGTIEPRKNHKLLLDIWQRLVAHLGDQAPHLVIVGSPGWSARELLKPLETDAALRAHVHHVSGLSSPALKQLMIGSAGLLMPSFAEGFGLPVLEANAMGVPTIASDIAAHREIANARTILLSPHDDTAWEEALLTFPPGAGRIAPPASDALGQAEYCRDVYAFMEACATDRAEKRLLWPGAAIPPGANPLPSNAISLEPDVSLSQTEPV
jgi:glycosyltransferase involved in cell wall biosynthesis